MNNFKKSPWTASGKNWAYNTYENGTRALHKNGILLCDMIPKVWEFFLKLFYSWIFFCRKSAKPSIVSSKAGIRINGISYVMEHLAIEFYIFSKND